MTNTTTTTAFGSRALAVCLAGLVIHSIGCASDLDGGGESLGGRCAEAGECGSSERATVGPGDFGLDCSAEKRVKLIALEEGDVIEARSCFYLAYGEIEYPEIANAYASVVDDDGEELAQFPLPEGSLVWLENGLGGHLWFYSAAYAPGAAAVDLYLRGHDTADYVRIGSTEIPGTYDGATLDYADEPDDGGDETQPDLDWHGAGWRLQGEAL